MMYQKRKNERVQFQGSKPGLERLLGVSARFLQNGCSWNSAGCAKTLQKTLGNKTCLPFHIVCQDKGKQRNAGELYIGCWGFPCLYPIHMLSLVNTGGELGKRDSILHSNAILNDVKTCCFIYSDWLAMW